MICNRNGITSVGRWEFVKAFVEDFVAILVAIHFATPFATKNDRENFVEISSKISLLQLKFDEIWTNCLTKFWQFFFVAKCCGKTFCHKAPDEKSDEILTKWKWKKQQRKSLYQNILQVVGNHGGVPSQFIPISVRISPISSTQFPTISPLFFWELLSNQQEIWCSQAPWGPSTRDESTLQGFGMLPAHGSTGFAVLTGLDDHYLPGKVMLKLDQWKIIEHM